MDRLLALHWRQPVGPEPASVYWQRRLAVLLGLALVVAVLVSLLPGTSDGPALSQQGPAGTASPRASASPSPRETGDPAPACPPEALRVQADAAPAEVPSGSGADLRVAVTNTSGGTCSVRLGAAAVQLVVLSGSDRIWSSADCDTPAGPSADPTDVQGDGRADLAPGERRLLTVTWDGRRSRPGCPGGGEVARPGTYRVLAQVGAVRVEGRAFRVV